MKTTKVCGHCKQEKPIGDFCVRLRGEGLRRASCRECSNKKERDITAARRRTGKRVDVVRKPDGTLEMVHR